MYCRIILFLFLCSSLAAQGQYDWKKRHQDIPGEIKQFFSEGHWQLGYDNCLKLENVPQIESIKIFRPDFYKYKTHSDTVLQRVDTHSEARVCIVSISTKYGEKFTEFRFEKADNGQWNYSTGDFRFCECKALTFPSHYPFRYEPNNYTRVDSVTPPKEDDLVTDQIIRVSPRIGKTFKLNVERTVDGMRLNSEKSSQSFFECDKGFLETKNPFGMFTSILIRQPHQKESIPVSGFVVSKDTVEHFLNKTLHSLGLTNQQRKNLVYLLSFKAKRNEYSLIHFYTETSLCENLYNIEPKPESYLKLKIVFKEWDPIDKIKPQRLPVDLVRDPTLFDWTFIDLDNPGKALFNIKFSSSKSDSSKAIPLLLKKEEEFENESSIISGKIDTGMPRTSVLK